MFHQKFYFVLLMLISSTLFSCGGKKNINIPSTILSKNEMIQILSDIHLAEATLEIKNYKLDSSNVMAIAFYNSIFKNHKIKYQIFEESFNYYSNNPKLLDDIYQQVVDDLTLKQTQSRKLAPAIPTTRDSLHRPRKIPLGFKHLPQQDH